MYLVEDANLIFVSVKSIILCTSYLWFLAKQPQFVLGSAHGVFGVWSWSWATILLLVSFKCVADGAIRTCSAQILTEVLKGEVPWRVKAGFKRLHHNG